MYLLMYNAKSSITYNLILNYALKEHISFKVTSVV